jgi:hypothetical protein
VPLIFAPRIGIVNYSIVNVKHCKERKKSGSVFVYKFEVSCQHALITTVNVQFEKAKQLTVSNAFPAQDFI